MDSRKVDFLPFLEDSEEKLMGFTKRSTLYRKGSTSSNLSRQELACDSPHEELDDQFKFNICDVDKEAKICL